MEMLDYALAWAARGFKVFPLRVGSKQPAVKDWPTLATTDTAQIRAWWTDQNFNIGTLTDDHIVVDVDNKRGKNGSGSFAALDLEFEDLATLTVATPTAGSHVYYHGPNRSLSVGKLGDGLDIRSYHGYVVAPGSHLVAGVDGNEVDGDYIISFDAPVRAVPQLILGRLDEPRIKMTQALVSTLDAPAAINWALNYLGVEAPPSVEGAGGDQTAFQVAARLKDYGLSEDMAFELLGQVWNERCSPPWSLEELREKVANAYAYGSLPAGYFSPEVDFAGVKLPEPEPAPPRAGRGWVHHGDAWDRNASWLYHDLLPSTGVALLTAPPQAGKTFVGLELARSLATGKPFFGVTPEDRGGTLLLFAGTEGSGLMRRLAALQEHESLPISAARVSALSEPQALTDLLADLQEESARILAVYGVPVRLIILETLSASGLLQDENSNSEAAAAMANLAQLSLGLGALLLTTHHPSSKGAGSRGASAIPASADYVLEISRKDKETVRSIELTKARDAEQRRLGTFSLLPVELGQDAKGRKVVSMTISSGGPAIAASRASQYGQLLVESVEWATIESGEEVDGRVLVDEEDLKVVFKERCPIKDRNGKERAFKAALAFAEETGAVAMIAAHGKKYVHTRRIEP